MHIQSKNERSKRIMIKGFFVKKQTADYSNVGSGNNVSVIEK